MRNGNPATEEHDAVDVAGTAQRLSERVAKAGGDVMTARHAKETDE